MVFSSLIFLFLFLPLVFACYYLAPRSYRNLILLLFSYFFYLWGSGEFLLILILSTMVDYVLALLIDRRKFWHPRGWLSLSLFFNLGLLAYFKYANFFVAEFNKLFSALGLSPLAWSHVVLPIGISFYTFQKITYVVDVYRGTRKAFPQFVDFALYVALFPQLIAGPIVRFHEISEQIINRVETLDGLYQGILRFCWGLVKKVLLANPCGEIADAFFGLDASAMDTKTSWLGVFAYTLQIYFDFSAYSDMAIGLGLMFGFKFPENFNRPYSSVSITDFWRRWHITLTNFFRDYLYIPLGGNRGGMVRTYLNLVIVFVLCGFWHGAQWTFLAWGVYHGGLLILERTTGLRSLDEKSYGWVRRMATLLLIMIGWVIFRATSLEQAGHILLAMFSPTNLPVPFELSVAINNRNLFLFSMGSLVFFLPKNLAIPRFLVLEKAPFWGVVQGGLLIALVLYSVAFIVSGSYNPFIYFQF